MLNCVFIGEPICITSLDILKIPTQKKKMFWLDRQPRINQCHITNEFSSGWDRSCVTRIVNVRSIGNRTSYLSHLWDFLEWMEVPPLEEWISMEPEHSILLNCELKRINIWTPNEIARGKKSVIKRSGDGPLDML